MKDFMRCNTILCILCLVEKNPYLVLKLKERINSYEKRVKDLEQVIGRVFYGVCND